MTFTVLVLLVAFAVGFAMKTGGLCTYAAAEQIVRRRRFERLQAFFGAAAWAFLVVVPLAWLFPGDVALSGTHDRLDIALVGGVVLGAGAWLNRGCFFGTFVQLVGGNLAYLATLPGMVAGALAVRIALADRLEEEGPVALVAAPTSWMALGFLIAAGIALTLVFDLRTMRRRPVAGLLIAMVIGIGGGSLFAAVKGWDLAAVMIQTGYRAWQIVQSGPVPLAVGSTLAMVAGGITAAIRQGRFILRLPGFGRALACLAGGMLMGAASVIIPGGNDGLLLSGIPALAPHAFAGYLAMLGSMMVLLAIFPKEKG